MSDGFMKWYRRRTDTQIFARQESLFQAYGVSLVHPARNVEILLDVDGNDVELPPGRILDLLNMKFGSINVEWWFSSDANLVCKYEYEPLGLEIQTYYLDSLTQAEANVLSNLLLAAAEDSDYGTRGLVIDRRGSTAEFDWDNVMLYGKLEIPSLPDLVVVPRDLAGKLSSLPSISATSVGLDLVMIEFTRT